MAGLAGGRGIAMDAELFALASTASTTVVTLLATDAWEKAKNALGTLWRRVHPERAATIEAELVDARTELLAAHAAGDQQTEQDLVAEWRGRLQRLLTADPRLADELRRLLDEQLIPALPAGHSWTGPVHMTAHAKDGRIYQVGQGDQHITER